VWKSGLWGSPRYYLEVSELSRTIGETSPHATNPISARLHTQPTHAKGGKKKEEIAKKTKWPKSHHESTP
jgi:hypothetical protein